MPAMPPPVATETEGLLAFLAQQRQALRNTAHGLTPEQLRASPSASALSVGGVLKHTAWVERHWIATNVLQQPSDRGRAEYQAEFQLEDDETLDSLLAFQTTVATETEAAVHRIGDLDHPVPVPPAPWFPKDVEAWSLRWVLLHLIEELARHAGQADVVRESVDGATQYELLAAAEGWPKTDWLTPWKPKGGTGG